MKWNDDKTITITPPKRPKKITGTRFAAIMGLNKWTTPFNAWCAITRTYEEPFEDTIYTVAGKTIEPKQAEFMKKSYFMTNLITPTDVYGLTTSRKPGVTSSKTVLSSVVCGTIFWLTRTAGLLRFLR